MVRRSIPLALRFAVLVASVAVVDDGTWSLFLDAQPGQPPSRDAHAAILDPVRHRLIVFGGPNGPPVSGTWAMSLGALPNCTRIASAGPQPLPPKTRGARATPGPGGEAVVHSRSPTPS